jgi:hypothetical protein
MRRQVGPPPVLCPRTPAQHLPVFTNVLRVRIVDVQHQVGSCHHLLSHAGERKRVGIVGLGIPPVLTKEQGARIRRLGNPSGTGRGLLCQQRHHDAAREGNRHTHTKERGHSALHPRGLHHICPRSINELDGWVRIVPIIRSHRTAWAAGRDASATSIVTAADAAARLPGSTLLRRSGAVDEQKDAVDDGRFSASGLQP